MSGEVTFRMNGTPGWSTGVAGNPNRKIHCRKFGTFAGLFFGRHNVKLNSMNRLLWIGILASLLVRAQNVEDAAELLRKVRSLAASTTKWRAEVVETSEMSGPGMNLQSEVRTRIAVQSPLKMSRQNSGSDRTILVCDGVETFYSGDGHTYYKGEARVTPNAIFR